MALVGGSYAESVRLTRSMWHDRGVTLFEELIGLVAALDDEPAMKALAARPQDIADIERLRDLDR